MTDYYKEQRNELEALESIYPDSFTVLSENPPSFTITVWSKGGPWGTLDQSQGARLECRPSHSLPTLRSKGSFLMDSRKAPRGSPKLGEWLA